jgi:uncharacterized protein YukE
MAEKFDATARLADGQPSVADLQSFVSACHALGYQHPDLTAHAAQVSDWYASEDGMNLHALDADCSALQAASAATGEALAQQDGQRATLAAAWQGGGAHASQEFLRRHGEASAHAAAAVRSAAHVLADLRERLWQAVDGKVATVLAIGDSVQPRRADWLAAAQTVTTGAGDRAVASELVDHEVKPFVDNVIGGQWLTAMHDAVTAIEAAYEAVNAELTSEGSTAFDVPGELGPAWTPAADDGVATGMPVDVVAAAAPGAAPVAPAGWSSPAVSPPPAVASALPVGSTPPAPLPAAPLSAPATPPLPDPGMSSGMGAPSMPTLGGGGGLPDIGGGLTGFGRQLGDLLSGLLGNDDAGLGSADLDDPAGIEEPDVEEPDDVGDEPDDELDDNDDDPEDEVGDDSEEIAEEDADAEPDEAEVNTGEPVEPAADAACAPEPPPPVAVGAPAEEPAATPPPEPLAVAPEPQHALLPERPADVPPADAASDSGTPCEIAADELPQAGE